MSNKSISVICLVALSGLLLLGGSSPVYTAQVFTEVFPGSLAGVYSGSVAWGDYDNDGDLDILLVGTTSSGRISKIYQNTGAGFSEVFVGSLTGVGFGSSVAWGDYDSDGDLDILLTGLDASNVKVSRIYQNTGTGFVQVFAGSLTGVQYGSVAWGDYDNDGDLDILITGNSGGNVSKIYQNTGTGFTEVFAGSLTGVGGSSVAWGDYDNDGDLDILLTGYSGVGIAPVSKIYRNTGTGFTEVFAGSLTGVGGSSAAWGDYDNDGDLDILLTGYSGVAPVSKIYRNSGTGFSEVFAGSLTGVYQSSAAWGDYDNDGDLDILLTGLGAGNVPVGKIFQNAGSGFVEVLAGSLTGVGFGSSVAWGDYDNDGDLDVLLTGASIAGSVSKTYRNDGDISNTAPAAPTGLNTSVSANVAVFSWDKATDAQTPQNGLTYNLRIGTSSNGVNRLSPMANVANGYRRVVRIGSVNHVASYTVKDLPAGAYYWSVQAIDGAFAGSPFATEGTFIVANPNHPPVANAGPDQTLIATSPSGASVTLDGTASSDPDGDPLTYIWTGSFGAVSGAIRTVTLPVGTHTVTLTVSDGQASSTDTVLVTVLTPAQATQNLIGTINGMGLPSGVTASLLGPLNQVTNLLSDNNPANDISACGSLNAFINEVNAKQASGQLTAAQANQLRQAANAIKVSLGCP